MPRAMSPERWVRCKLSLSPVTLKIYITWQGGSAIFFKSPGCHALTTIRRLLGLFLSWLQKTYKLIGLSSSFIIDAYPVSIQPTDILIILAGSLLLSLAASWYPALRASKIEPADAVRYE